MFFRRGLCLVGLLIIVLAAKAESRQDKPKIISSIKPVQLLVAAIGGEQIESQLLLPPTVSPHLYQLRPSDRRALANADRVFWIGPDLERFLVKPLSLLDADTAVSLHGEALSNEIATSGHHDDHHHDHHEGDPHSWLNPLNALAMAEQIAHELSQLSPDNQSYYQQRLQVFHRDIQELDQSLSELFAQQQAEGYLVLHDAYGHFEQRYGLEHKASVSVSPERKPGVKRLLQIQALLDSGQIGCVFTEPQYQQASLQKVLHQASVRKAVLDPLAIEVEASDDGYLQFMRGFSSNFYRCISPLHTQDIFGEVPGQ